MNTDKLTPVTRNNKFYSEEDFQYELSLIEEYIEEDLNQVVIVYEIDRAKTNINTTYNESKEPIRYKAPRELPCMFEIKESETKSYDGQTNNGVYAISGNLTINVPNFMFEKYNCHIRRGDYIGVPIETGKMAYFVVTNDGKINYSNDHYVGAYRTAWTTISCTPTVEFDGK